MSKRDIKQVLLVSFLNQMDLLFLSLKLTIIKIRTREEKKGTAAAPLRTTFTESRIKTTNSMLFKGKKFNQSSNSKQEDH